MSYVKAQVPSAVAQETGSGSCQLWGWNLAQHHCHHILLVKAVIGFPHIQWEGTETSLPLGRMSKTLWPSLICHVCRSVWSLLLFCTLLSFLSLSLPQHLVNMNSAILAWDAEVWRGGSASEGVRNPREQELKERWPEDPNMPENSGCFPICKMKVGIIYLGNIVRLDDWGIPFLRQSIIAFTYLSGFFTTRRYTS